VVIIDGYNDEPAGLGVPPYLDVYARYIAGAVWSYDDTIKINYYTIDEIRDNFERAVKKINRSQLVIVIGGTLVPGKYVGGKPIKPEEILKLGKILINPLKIIGGPMVKFGIGVEGGKRARILKEVKDIYDVIIEGDPEIVIYDLLEEKLNVDLIDPKKKRKGYDEIREMAIKGARIVREHPNYKLNLICEIETYRGCPRSIVGGCSFCTETLHGLPVFRPIKDIVREVEELYRYGVKNFRLGRQPDLYSYMSKGVGEKEFPEPNPMALRKLFSGIRKAAPKIEVLHIDNVNPGTVANYPEKAREITKIIVKYHTSGDVAAFGIESADPKVIRANNLKVMPDEALKAIKIINEIGGKRGSSGLPELLPGINFVYGLIGETKKTYELNFEFMRKILEEGLLVRRINIRQCIPLPGTRMWSVGNIIVMKHKQYFKKYKEIIRREIDRPMLRRIIPEYMILKRVFTEKYLGNTTLARQIGSYPILVRIPYKCELYKFRDIMVIEHGYRSVTGIPIPIKINRLEKKVLMRIPGIGEKTAGKIKLRQPIKNTCELENIIERKDLIEKIRNYIDFSH